MPKSNHLEEWKTLTYALLYAKDLEIAEALLENDYDSGDKAGFEPEVDTTRDGF